MKKNAEKPVLRIDAAQNDTREAAIAKAALRPTLQGAATVQRYVNWMPADLELNELVNALSEQTRAVIGDDLSRGEAMLTVQAHTLDAIFNDLARRAALNVGEYIQAAETYMKLALRAQSQCRATWEAISTIKNPPIAGYVGQANIAQGPQQVNNEAATRARENETGPNKLLECRQHEPDQQLDRRTPAAAASDDPAVEAVGTVDRPAHDRR